MTSTSLALKEAAKMFESTNNEPEDASRILFVLTDGNPSDGEI